MTIDDLQMLSKLIHVGWTFDVRPNNTRSQRLCFSSPSFYAIGAHLVPMTQNRVCPGVNIYYQFISDLDEISSIYDAHQLLSPYYLKG